MRLFADTSDPDLIEQLHKDGVIEGVTTNPTTASQYLRKAGGKMYGLAYEIANRVGGIPISIEAIGCGPKNSYNPEKITAERLYREGAVIIDWMSDWPFADFWVKMPTIPQGIEATHMLVRDFNDTAKINSTLGFDRWQGIRAARAGAHVYSLFMCRMQAEGEDAIGVAKEIIGYYKNCDSKTGFLAASMRNPEIILESWKAGADIATAPPEVLQQLLGKYPNEFEHLKSRHPPERKENGCVVLDTFLDSEFKHPLLEKGLKQFVSDAARAGYDLLG